MKFDINGDLNPGEWFDIDDDEEDSGQVCLRVANRELTEKIANDCLKTKVIYHRGTRYKDTEVDEEKQFKLIWDYCIVDWKGITDKDGVEIPCTSENKYKLIRQSIFFLNFVKDCQTEINDINKNDEEEEIEEGAEEEVGTEKNLSTPQDGD